MAGCPEISPVCRLLQSAAPVSPGKAFMALNNLCTERDASFRFQLQLAQIAF